MTGTTVFTPLALAKKVPEAEVTTLPIPINEISSVPKPRNVFFYPPDIANDLSTVTDLSPSVKAEIFACAWEYTRCAIPQYTNWKRYVAFMRTVIICAIAEFRGEMFDMESNGDDMFGYNVQEVLDDLFEGTPGQERMSREFRAFLLLTADKSSARRDEELFRRYVNSLAQSPRQWFRMRDADGLVRFVLAAALACCDLDDVWFTEDEFEILSEMGVILYDAVAFYKHRAEGETHSTFAYMPVELRTKSFHLVREVLWALDVAWAQTNRPYHQAVINFTRFFGGPIHMLMRRYRFVEDGLAIGKPEDEHVVDQTRQNYKLWHRNDAKAEVKSEDRKGYRRYKYLVTERPELMYPELPEFLETGGDGSCSKCVHRDGYGARSVHVFGGVQLCDECRTKWGDYLNSFHTRAAKVFPELLQRAGTDAELRTPGYDEYGSVLS
ncbi:hypothetical protein DFH08DRAFT_922757 [Mycena albidolilacea]|uniref:Uncharacterized protein n=1 Tax=Mycena albidolilacea TaxID=1033008 RepID=A0AAD7AEK1_9AGAR|nr:hypothetical protein DFH08DRAFT_922757 [Mycena albidolilacea]